MTTNTTDRRLVTIVLLVLGAFVVLPALFMGFGMMGGYGPMMGGGMWGGGMWGDGTTVRGWMLLAGIISQVLFLAVIVGSGYLLYQAVTRDEGSDPALEELRLAYARGDLTDEEFQSRREALERNE